MELFLLASCSTNYYNGLLNSADSYIFLNLLIAIICFISHRVLASAVTGCYPYVELQPVDSVISPDNLTFTAQVSTSVR